MKGDNVHGGHSEAGAVDEAADVAVKANVVEVGSSSNDFSLILLSPVSEVEDVLLSVGGVGVEVDLGVHGEDFTSGVFSEGVDFEKRAVLNMMARRYYKTDYLLLEELVHLHEVVGSFVLGVSWEAHLGC